MALTANRLVVVIELELLAIIIDFVKEEVMNQPQMTGISTPQAMHCLEAIEERAPEPGEDSADLNP